MTSENLFSALSAYSAVAVIPIAIATIAFTERGWGLLTSTSRSARQTLRPSEGTCERKTWGDMKDGPLHICISIWPADCHERQHVRRPRCWERSLAMVLNNQQIPFTAAQLEDKPKILPLSKDFLLVDVKVVLAFILMAVGSTLSTRDLQTNSRTFHIAGVVLEIQTIKDGLVLLHVQGSLQRTLAKEYVERLLGGYPPLLEDPRSTNLFKDGDERRGGWVVKIGLDPDYNQEDTFLAVYHDCVCYKHRRGHVFWRSMDRVRLILTEVWADAFADDPASSKDIAIAILALELISKRETESGVEKNLFDLSMPTLPLTDQERSRIISHFNGPPLIAASQRAQFKLDWEPLLRYILVAAVRGSTRCIAYFKNPGRELETILPIDVLSSSDLYLRGC